MNTHDNAVPNPADSAAIHRLLNQSQAGPSVAHDEAVFRAADRLLQAAEPAPARHWQMPVALAATIVMALCVTLPGALRVDTPPPAPTVRAGESAAMPQPGARLTALPSHLRWSPVSGASGYRVVLRDGAADIVWTSELLRHPELALAGTPSSHLAGLTTCIWSVEVVGFHTSLELGPYWFHLKSR